MPQPDRNTPLTDNWRDAPGRGVPRNPPLRAPDYLEPARELDRHDASRHDVSNGVVLVLIVVVVVLLVALVGGAAWLFLLRPGAPFSGAAAPAVLSSSQTAVTAQQGAFTATAAQIAPTPGNSIVPGRDADGQPTAIIASLQQSPNSAGKTEGAYVTVEAPTAQTLSGKSITVVVVARAGAGNPTSRFALAYSSGPLGNSGWITFVPTTAFQPYSFRLRVPASQQAGANYVGIWADVAGLGRTLEVSQVRIDIMP